MNKEDLKVGMTIKDHNPTVATSGYRTVTYLGLHGYLYMDSNGIESYCDYKHLLDWDWESFTVIPTPKWPGVDVRKNIVAMGYGENQYLSDWGESVLKSVLYLLDEDRQRWMNENE